MTHSLPAIVLAAGASRRLGEPKQLLTLEGETLLARTIRMALTAGANPVYVVIGAHSGQVSKAFENTEGIAVLNHRWMEGIASSIHAGLLAVNEDQPDSPGVLILACDQPRLSVAHLRNLIDAFSEQADPSIAASEYSGALGVPAAFPRRVFPYLFALQGDKGARTLLLRPPCPLIQVAFDGGEIDIDRPEDRMHLG